MRTARTAIAASLLAVSLAGAQSPVALPGAGIRLDSGRVTVVADRRDERLARSMLHEAVAHDSFPDLPKPVLHVLIAIAPTAALFRAWVGPAAPEWGAAIALPEEQRIVMQGSYAGSDAGNPVVVLRHELAHLALHETLGDLPPRWFDEGYASLAAGEWSRADALETSTGLAWRSLPDVEDMDAGFLRGSSMAEWSYALAHLAVAEMQGIDRQHGLANFFTYWKRSESYEQAVREAYGLTGMGFDAYWQKQVRRRYGALAFAANLSLAFGLFGLLLGPLFWARRRRDRRRLEVMRAADAAQEEAARRSALEALLATSAAPAGPPRSLDTL